MYRKNILFIFLISCIVAMSVSCVDDNKGYEEYYHPMGNNPVMVIPWLKRVKKSFLGKEGRISVYKMNDKEYYMAQVILNTGPIPTGPCTIYETDEEKAIIYLYSENALDSEQDEAYANFIKNAELVKVLWSNESKYSPYDF